MRTKVTNMLVVLGGVMVGLGLLVFFGLGYHRPPRFIQNFEEEEYGAERPFITPHSVQDSLAVYIVGKGEPVLLFPYPHSHTTAPMAQSVLAEALIEQGFQVISFDVPGAYRSTRPPTGTMEEMVRTADEALERLEIFGPVHVVGHSMSGCTALAYAVERPARVRRLVLVTAVSGFPAAARYGLPFSAYHIFDREYWQILVWGMRANAGRASLSQHKKLMNLMSETSFHKKERFTPVAVDEDDGEKGTPVRSIWSANMYTRLDYSGRLGEITAPTLVVAGRHDPEAPLACSEEIAAGIPDAKLVIFEESGHYPYLEEPERFSDVVTAFLNR
jgi:pimeloyl-ACP methyl ester carboxylesterase